MKTIICGAPECKKEFEPKCHNAKYCSKDCRTKVMNKRILERYYKKKAIKSGKGVRVCLTTGCTTILSRYNSEDICERHRLERFEKKLIKWGWDKEQLIEEFRD